MGKDFLENCFVTKHKNSNNYDMKFFEVLYTAVIFYIAVNKA